MPNSVLHSFQQQYKSLPILCMYLFLGSTSRLCILSHWGSVHELKTEWIWLIFDELVFWTHIGNYTTTPLHSTLVILILYTLVWNRHCNKCTFGCLDVHTNMTECWALTLCFIRMTSGNLVRAMRDSVICIRAHTRNIMYQQYTR